MTTIWCERQEALLVTCSTLSFLSFSIFCIIDITINLSSNGTNQSKSRYSDMSSWSELWSYVDGVRLYFTNLDRLFLDMIVVVTETFTTLLEYISKFSSFKFICRYKLWWVITCRRRRRQHLLEMVVHDDSKNFLLLIQKWQRRPLLLQRAAYFAFDCSAATVSSKQSSKQ